MIKIQSIDRTINNSDAANISEHRTNITQQIRDWEVIKKLQKRVSNKLGTGYRKEIMGEFDKRVKEYNINYGPLNLSKKPDSFSQVSVQPLSNEYKIA